MQPYAINNPADSGNEFQQYYPLNVSDSEPSTSVASRKPWDYYCIVEILEANQNTLISVPLKWVRNNNILSWPKYIFEENIKLALADVAFKPKEEDCWERPCILIGKGYFTKLDADSAISTMNARKSLPPQNELRVIVREELQPFATQLKAGLEKLYHQVERFRTIMTKKTSEITTELSRKQMASPQKHDSCSDLSLMPSSLAPINFNFKVITEMHELNWLESELKNNETYKQQFIRHMSQFCGMHIKGLDAAPLVIKKFWTREFLSQYSWTGNSVTGKIKFRSYSAVIDAFYEIVYNADNAFTMPQAEEFLKNQMLNATKRAALKSLRISPSKYKPSSAGNLDVIEVQKNYGNESEEDPSQLDIAAANITDQQISQLEEWVRPNNESVEVLNDFDTELLSM